MDFRERLGTSVVMVNPQADRVKDVAALAGRRVRAKKRQFLVEGPQAVREALRHHLDSAPVLDAVYTTEAAFTAHPDIADLLEAAYGTPTPEPGRRVFMRMVTEPVLAAMADSVSPQGMVAVAFHAQPAHPAVFGAGGINPRLALVLCRVQDPGNAGTIVRAADAAGADLVLTTAGTVDLYNPKTVRASAGSIFHLPLLQGIDLQEFAEDAKARGMGILAADGYGKVSLDHLTDAATAHRLGIEAPQAAYDLARPTLWLFGNEAGGLAENEKAVAHARVAVPLHGRAESLNVGMAATVCLYASARALTGKNQ